MFRKFTTETKNKWLEVNKGLDRERGKGSGSVVSWVLKWNGKPY